MRILLQLRVFLALLISILGFAAHAQDVPPLTGEELKEFLGPVSPNLIRWTKQPMIDFQLYNGDPVPPVSGHIGFYVGSAPHPEYAPNSSIVRGHLGKYSVKWHRWNEDGQVKQEAVIYMRWFQVVDIWISGRQASDVEKLASIVSQLPLFNEKPTPPIPEMNNRADELLDTHPSLNWAVILCVPALFLIGVWLFNRRLRRLVPKLSGRMARLMIYSIGFFFLVAALLWFFAPIPFSCRQ